MIIYEIKELNLRFWHKLDKMEFPWSDIAIFVKAAVFIKENHPDFRDWDYQGEYWLSQLPMPKQYIVIIRPGPNPHQIGLVVSPIDLPISGRKIIEKDHVPIVDI